MKCFTHPDRDAVATCAKGCGRSLCKECSSKTNPPVCEVCEAEIINEEQVVVADSRAQIIKKMKINALMMLPYIIGPMFGDPATASPLFSLMILIPIIVWGFFAFKWFMNALLNATGLTIFSSLGSLGIVYLIGAIVTAMLGFLIIPVLLLLEWRQLRKLPQV